LRLLPRHHEIDQLSDQPQGVYLVIMLACRKAQ